MNGVKTTLFLLRGTASLSLRRPLSFVPWRLSSSSASSSSSFFNYETPVTTPKPPSEAWFEGKPAYTDLYWSLRDLEHRVRQHLHAQCILPSYSTCPTEAFPQGVSLEPEEGVSNAAGSGSEGVLTEAQVTAHLRSKLPWMNKEQMRKQLGGLPLSDSDYEKLVDMCKMLNDFLPLAKLADRMGPSNLVEQVAVAIDPLRRPVDVRERIRLESSIRDGLLSEEDRRARMIDNKGRAFATGRRKTAFAKVWMVPVKTELASPENTVVGQVLINAKPIHYDLKDYFARLAAIAPFTATGTLGKYNVFALVEGGGETGRSGAISLAIAKCLTAFEGPAAQQILESGGLLTRDPRMRERKKTNQPKARKKFRWVKR